MIDKFEKELFLHKVSNDEYNDWKSVSEYSNYLYKEYIGYFNEMNEHIMSLNPNKDMVLNYVKNKIYSWLHIQKYISTNFKNSIVSSFIMDMVNVQLEMIDKVTNKLDRLYSDYGGNSETIHKIVNPDITFVTKKLTQSGNLRKEEIDEYFQKYYTDTLILNNQDLMSMFDVTRQTIKNWEDTGIIKRSGKSTARHTVFSKEEIINAYTDNKIKKRPIPPL